MIAITALGFEALLSLKPLLFCAIDSPLCETSEKASLYTYACTSSMCMWLGELPSLTHQERGCGMITVRQLREFTKGISPGLPSMRRFCMVS